MTVVTHTDLATTIIQYLMIDGMVRRNTATTQEKIIQKLHPYCTICTICTMQNLIRPYFLEKSILFFNVLNVIRAHNGMLDKDAYDIEKLRISCNLKFSKIKLVSKTRLLHRRMTI